VGVVARQAGDGCVALLKTGAELETDRLKPRDNGCDRKSFGRLRFITVTASAHSDLFFPRKLPGITNAEISGAGFYCLDVAGTGTVTDFAGYSRSYRVKFRACTALLHVGRMARETPEGFLGRDKVSFSLL